MGEWGSARLRFAGKLGVWGGRLVPLQLVATNVGQPRRETLFEIAPSSSRFQVTLSPAGVVNAQTSLIVDRTQGPAMGGGTH